MTRTDRLRYLGHLLSPVHLEREIVRIANHHAQVRYGNDHFAVRDDQPIVLPARDNAGNSISQVAPDNSVHDVSRQPDYVGQHSFCIQPSHCDDSPAYTPVGGHCAQLSLCDNTTLHPPRYYGVDNLKSRSTIGTNATLDQHLLAVVPLNEPRFATLKGVAR